MIRLARYLKPYMGMVLLAIVLLFAQANFDLALPDYLSRIVNVGIQQGGIENAVPLAMRESQMAKLLIFVSDEDRAAVLDAYKLIDQASPEYETAVQDYPILGTEPVYVRSAMSQEEIDRLSPVTGRAILVVSLIDRLMADPSSIPDLGADLPFDPSMIPPGADLFALLAQLPAAQLEQIKSRIGEQFALLGDRAIIQAAARPIQAEYEAVGLDTHELQTSYILGVGGVMLLLTLSAGACTIGGRRGARYPQGSLQQGGELLQHRVRQLLHCLPDHAHHE
jgi:ATP-binding cassette subfamily B multidrug efflux pump